MVRFLVATVSSYHKHCRAGTLALAHPVPAGTGVPALRSPPERIEQCRAAADAVVEAVEPQILVRGVVRLVVIAIRRHEGRDAEDSRERIARQAAEAGRIDQRVDAVRGAQGLA